MIAGPNGSGKSTLLSELVARGFPLGRVLNPDELERQWMSQGLLDLLELGISEEDGDLAAFVRSHPLAGRGVQWNPLLSNGVLTAPVSGLTGYAIAILCDFLRQSWIRQEESFTFETVMSHPD